MQCTNLLIESFRKYLVGWFAVRITREMRG